MPYDFTNDKRCASVKKEDFAYMGYTVRTAEWRYTEYALWDGQALRPKWNTSIPSFGSQLYDHRKDDGLGVRAFDDTENENLAFSPQYAETVAQLSQQLRKFFSSASPQELVV